MKFDPRVLRTLLIWTVILVATLVSGLAAILETGVFTPKLLAWANERLEREGGLHVEAASVYLRPWSGLTLRDVWLTIPSEGHPAVRERLRENSPPAGENAAAAPDSVAAPASPPIPAFAGAPRNHVFSVGEIEVGYRFAGLLRGAPRISRVKLVRPDLDVVELRRWITRRAENRPLEEAGSGRSGRGFVLDDLRILEGRVEAGDGTVLSGLRMAGSVEKRDDDWWLLVEEAGAHLGTDRIEEDLELTGDVVFGDGGIRLEGLHLGVAGGRLSFEGSLDPSGTEPTEIRATGFALSLERVGSWFGATHPLLEADLEFHLLASGRPDSLALSGGFRGRAEGGLARDFDFAGVRRGDRVDVEYLRVVVGDSHLDLSGRLTLGDSPGLDGVAIFRDLELATILADEDFTAVSGLNGIVRFEGTGLTRSTFDGEADVRISKADLFGLAIDSAELRPSLRNGELVLGSATIRKGGTIVTGIGSIDAGDRVVAELQGRIGDLADLGDAFGGATAEALGGQAAVEVRVLGPLAGPALEATLVFAEASVFGARARSLEIGVTSDRLAPGAELTLDVVGTRIGYGGREIPRATASGALANGALSVNRVQLESDRRGSLSIAGHVVVAGDTLAGTIGQLAVVPPEGGVGWSNSGPIRIERRADHLEISGLDLRRGAGHVTADARIATTGETFLRASGEHVDLAVFSPYLLVSEELDGDLEFEADAILGADTLAVDLRVDLTDGRWGDHSLEAIRGRFALRDDRAVFDEMVFRSSVATADLDGELALASGSFREVLGDSTARARMFDRVECRGLRARLESPDWSWFWDVTPWPDLGGAGTMVMTIEGPATAPRADLWARLVSGDLGPEPLEEMIGVGRYESDRITIDEGWVRSGAGRLDLSGTLPVTWSLANLKPDLVRGQRYDLSLSGKNFPARALAAFVPLFESIRGTAEAEVTLTGVPDSAHFVGGFSVADAVVRIPGFVDPLVGGQATGRFDSGGVEIIGARLGDGRGGRIAGRGRVELANLKATDWRIDVDVRDARYRGEINGIDALGSGRLAILAEPQPVGPPLARFLGSFEVESAAMDERVLAPPASATALPEMPAGVNAPEPTAEEIAEAEAAARAAAAEAPPTVLAEIAFQADNNLWLRTPEHQVELAGAVTLHSTPEYVGLTGSLATLQGTYSVLNTTFAVERAEVRFFDPSDPGATSLDAEATTTVLDEEVTAVVTGTLAVPVIQLTTESGMTEREIYELLALRQKRDQAAAGEDEAGMVSSALVASWGAVLASRFGRELGREVGLDTFDVEQGQATTHIGVGKSIGSNLFLRYRQEVANTETLTTSDTYRERLETPERQLLLEYRLSRIFQLQGETGTIQGDGYLNVDLKAEWGY